MRCPRAAYSRPWLWIAALVLTLLSFVYSLVDEAFHWRRYVRSCSDRVEMWSHVGIFLGHGVMMLGWWVWYFQGYSASRRRSPRSGSELATAGKQEAALH
jgi:hypothetical protein